MTNVQIKELCSIVRSINGDEFHDKSSVDTDFEFLKGELLFLQEKLLNQKNRKQEIILHTLKCSSEKNYKQFPISNLNDELDVISMGFNVYLEELEEKTVSRDFFFQIFRVLPQKIFVFDQDGKINFVNFFGKEIFGRNMNVSGIKIEEILPVTLLIEIEGFIKSGSDKLNFEVEIYSDENNPYTAHLACSVVSIDEVIGGHLLLVVDDISLKKDEEKRILKATMLGQEMERKRLAYDLHDSLGQELNALKMHLNSIETMGIDSPKYQTTMVEIHQMLNDSIMSIRDISFDLMPIVLGNNDLVSSVSQLINKLNLITEMEIKFTYSSDFIKLKDKKNELFIYRILQEFINNSLKYSQGSQILVSFNQTEKNGNLNIQLSDDGVGFDFQNIDYRNGINNIEQRLSILNAKFRYYSEIGHGTLLKFLIYE